MVTKTFSFQLPATKAKFLTMAEITMSQLSLTGFYSVVMSLVITPTAQKRSLVKSLLIHRKMEEKVGLRTITIRRSREI